jgi:hypothetical protein
MTFTDPRATDREGCKHKILPLDTRVGRARTAVGARVSRRLKHRTIVRRVRGAFRTCAGEGPIGTVPVWSGGDAVLVDETAEPIHAPYSRRVGES